MGDLSSMFGKTVKVPQKGLGDLLRPVKVGKGGVPAKPQPAQTAGDSGKTKGC